jgi:hypothetical protein
VDEIAQQARESGATRIDGPVVRPWNVRDVTVYDPDGYRLRFSEPMDLDRSFDEVMRQQGEGTQE